MLVVRKRYVTWWPHNDVMKAIRKMEIAWQKVQGGNFSLSSRTYELREQTTLAQMLTNKLEFIKQLMSDSFKTTNYTN